MAVTEEEEEDIRVEGAEVTVTPAVVEDIRTEEVEEDTREEVVVGIAEEVEVGAMVTVGVEDTPAEVAEDTRVEEVEVSVIFSFVTIKSFISCLSLNVLFCSVL